MIIVNEDGSIIPAETSYLIRDKDYKSLVGKGCSEQEIVAWAEEHGLGIEYNGNWYNYHNDPIYKDELNDTTK